MDLCQGGTNEDEEAQNSSSVTREEEDAPPPPELDEPKGAKCYRMREGADAGVFSKELFWHIVKFWRSNCDL